MTEENCFLKVILDDPADDTPRLVYADWLDERGDNLNRPADKARARFIRLQVEYARQEPEGWKGALKAGELKSQDSIAEFGEQRAAASRQINELLTKWRDRWSPRPSRRVGSTSSGVGHELEFARGFPDVLTIQPLVGTDVVLPFVRGCLQAAPISEVNWRVQEGETGLVENWSLRIWRSSRHWFLREHCARTSAGLRFGNSRAGLRFGNSRQDAIRELVRRLRQVLPRVLVEEHE